MNSYRLRSSTRQSGATIAAKASPTFGGREREAQHHPALCGSFCPNGRSVGAVIELELAEEVVVVGRDPAARLVRRHVLDVHLDQRVIGLQPLEDRAFRLAHAVDDVVRCDRSGCGRLIGRLRVNDRGGDPVSPLSNAASRKGTRAIRICASRTNGT